MNTFVHSNSAVLSLGLFESSIRHILTTKQPLRETLSERCFETHFVVFKASKRYRAG